MGFCGDGGLDDALEIELGAAPSVDRSIVVEVSDVRVKNAHRFAAVEIGFVI